MYSCNFKDLVRINADEPEHKPLTVSLSAYELDWRAGNVSMRDINAVWYRKGRQWFVNSGPTLSAADDTRFTKYLEQKVAQERAVLSDYLHAVIERSVPTLGSTIRAVPNKLSVLRTAADTGLPVPETLIVNNRNDLLSALQRHPAWITKPLSDTVYFFDHGESECGYFTYTESVTVEMLASVPDVFIPSLLQRQIEKRYDIRTFFLDDTFYSTAILSQSEARTSIDWRKYDIKHPTRCVPYRLPQAVEAKLRKLLSILSLNTTSIDLIHGRDGEYYFLEVNPVGQFESVSTYGNYYLERRIATCLAGEETHERT